MGALGNGFGSGREDSVDVAWAALCAELEANVRVVARKFVRTEQAHLSFTEVHDLAQLVDLAWDGEPLDAQVVEFATQCLTQVADRAVRTHFRPKYFSDYKCLEALWEASARHRHRGSTHAGAHPVS